MAKLKQWTEEEDGFIKKNYLKMDTKALAKKFKVTVKSIEGKIRRMELEKPKLAKKSEKPKLPEKSGKPKLSKKSEKPKLVKKSEKPKLIEKSEKLKLAKKSEKKERLLIHQNIRCRTCFLADGYTEVEENCRYCGAKLFKLDVI